MNFINLARDLVTGYRRRKYIEFITHETEKANAKIHSLIAQGGCTEFQCVDPATPQGSHEAPGGLVYLYDNNLLEQLYQANIGNAIKLGAHTYCGYLFSQGYTTLEQQVDKIAEASTAAYRLAEIYGCDITVNVYSEGSAKKFMPS